MGTLLHLLLATPAAGLQEPTPAPDPVYFEDRIAPLVRSTCATSGCHGATAGAGNLRYEQAGFGGEFTEEQHRANLRASLAFVRPGKPEESLLYRKSIREADGGLPHGGRSYALAKESEEAAAIAAWIRGERLVAAPIAEASAPPTASPGSRVLLDGSASRDRRGAPLTFRWTAASSPRESPPRIEDADRARAWFVPTAAGTYDLALTVGNGEAESTAHVALSVERLPYVRLEVGQAELAAPFEAVPDDSASGGRFLSAAAEEGARAGHAQWSFEVAEEGDYDLWVRARSPGGGAMLSFSLDGAAPSRWSAPPSEEWILSPVASGGAARRSVVSGTWEQRDGALVGAASRGRPALVLLEARAAEGTVDVTVRPGSEGGAFVQIGSREREAGVCAGIDGKGKFVVGGLLRGRLRPLAEADAPRTEPGAPISFRVAFERGRVRLLSGEKVVLERDVPAPPGAGMRPGARRAAPPPPEVGLLVPAGSARFEEVSVRRRGEVVYEDRFEGRERGLRLKPGEHRLRLTLEEGSAALDEILLARAGAAARLSPEDRRFARAACLDLLRRTPSEVELLSAGSDPSGLPGRLAGSLEFWQAWYEEELYHFLLIDNFRPAIPSLASLPVRLANGSANVAQAVRELVISQNFNARNPGPDTFVTVVLEQLLGMKVQEKKEALEAGKRMYDGHPARLFGKEGRSQADFVEIAMGHEDFAPVYLGRFHRAIFGEGLPSEDPAIARFRADPSSFPGILRDWIASDSYRARLGTPRAKTDPMFIRSLFVDLLGRPPSYREFRNMRNALQALSDPGPLRSVMARVFVDSGRSPLPRKDRVEDPDAWIAEQFLRFFARAPSEAEREAFRKGWEDPGCTPATVLTALVTSKEYQVY
ncbi:MAG TPA: hypothetical protein VFI25_03260 [Planctomycetota bacterium]|nr:hypothetical protein [Planctomycetota bacterium]